MNEILILIAVCIGYVLGRGVKTEELSLITDKIKDKLKPVKLGGVQRPDAKRLREDEDPYVVAEKQAMKETLDGVYPPIKPVE